MTDPTRNGRRKAVSAADRHLANRAINRSDLISGAKSVLLAIADRAGHGSSVCTASYNSLVSMTGKDRRWVIRLAKRLARSGWIEIERRKSKLRGHEPNEIRMGQKFAEAVEEQREFERKIAEENRFRRGKLGQVLDPSGLHATPLVVCTPPASGLHATQTTPLTTPENVKTTTTLSGKAPREPGSDDEPEKSSSSSIASLQKSGGTRGAESRAEAIDPKRLAAAIAAVTGLGLRRDEGDAGPMNEATAEKLIRAAAKGSSGGLRWVAWAISAAAKRRNTAKGRLAAKYWTYVTVILRNWKNGDGMPGEGWPGEGTAAPKKTQEAYSPWA